MFIGPPDTIMTTTVAASGSADFSFAVPGSPCAARAESPAFEYWVLVTSADSNTVVPTLNLVDTFAHFQARVLTAADAAALDNNLGFSAATAISPGSACILEIGSGLTHATSGVTGAALAFPSLSGGNGKETDASGLVVVSGQSADAEAQEACLACPRRAPLFATLPIYPEAVTFITDQDLF